MNIKTQPRPVLMIPLRRCGSHALRLRLNANKDFYAPYPLHIVDFMPLLELYGDLNDDNHYFQLITDVIGLQSGLMVKWPGVVLDPVDIFEAIKYEPRSIHRVIWEMLFETGREQEASVVMDKSLDSIHYVDDLLELFPDMLFLNVVRDPRAQISSMNRAIIHDFDIMLNAKKWVLAYDEAKILATRYPEKLLTIRFEDFIVNQAEIIQKICEFFSLEFTAEMLDIDKSDEAISISKRSTLWESNSSAPISANVDKFKKLLTDDEIEVIETLAGKHMDYYGYERMTAGEADVSEKKVHEAEKRNIINKEAAWKALKINDPRDYMLRKFRIDYMEMIRDRLNREKELFQKSA
ncbi:MAG: sulfotransferase [Gammaproteobacteria bacterium]